MRIRHAVILTMLAFVPIGVLADCQSGYTLRSVSDDGSIVVLMDGDVFAVASEDQATAESWTDADDIDVCEYAGYVELIDVDSDGDVVNAKLIATGR